MTNFQFDEIMRALRAIIVLVWCSGGAAAAFLFLIYCQLGDRRK